MLRVSGIAVPLDEEAACRGGASITSGPLVERVAKQLDVEPGAIESVQVLRRSVDARRKEDVHFVANVAVQLFDASAEQRLIRRGFAEHAPYEPLEVPSVPAPDVPPVVVGTGPAGLFAALYLARAGVRPVVLERGQNVEQRAQDVASFNATGELDVHSNIQFGEGGAGTFSDGKLHTNTNSKFTRHVLHWFAEAGAPGEVLWDAQPHIGSDRLPAVVAAMRNEIVERGGQVLFGTQLTDVRFDGGQLCAIECTDVRANAASWRDCRELVVACGHSARDTFSLLQQRGTCLQQKPFAVGMRIEHPQSAINLAQWASAASSGVLGAASYKLVHHGSAGRGVFTFCMCPGGEVVCSASEAGGTLTNGMSPFARDGQWSNAAVLVGVVPEDFGGSADPLSGVGFQRQIERRAFQESEAAGGSPYSVPAQTVGAFLARQVDDSLPATSCARGTVACNLWDILPAFVCEAIAEALPAFGRKIAGFDAEDAVLLGPETRSSSPVRIARNDDYQAWLVQGQRQQGCGIYPAGEGAGYAGGIMSAACDGLRVAAALAATY